MQPSLPDAVIETPESPSSKGRKLGIAAFVALVLICLAWAAAVLLLDVKAWYIPSESMAPAVGGGDRVITYKLGDVERGDIVVFDKPESISGVATDLIKRVIALEGETISFENGEVHIDGELLTEPYLTPEMETYEFPDGPGDVVRVPEGHVFVMGDNRNRSIDSRSYGPIPIETISGNNHWVWNSGD